MSNAVPADLPRRPGPRPSTTPTNPHTQLDQQPSDDQPRQRLIGQLSDLPGVVWTGSMISVPGAEALTLPRGTAQGPPDAFMIDTEFAHLHPAPDHSLHVVLPVKTAEAAIEAGWAELHPIARRGIISPGAVMVYAPRDAVEADIAADLVRTSYAYATGTQPPLRAADQSRH
ncbi:luciferase family protein [Microbacterium sp.]|jgi:hypothetical protein|uniref:luciferase domain-containing protein n=1 Tax=Microbacterium sp. TaxID=51671 RepID=UPI0025F669FC|nr:luciferase family protein [Microbacterium sp.]